MRLIAIDPALRKTGFALLEQRGGQVHCLSYGVIQNKPTLSMSQALVNIRQELALALDRYQPEVCAIEATIFVQSYKTAITLGAARAAALIATAERGLPIYEYAPRRVKQAVVGRGGADKTQVAFMIRSLLGLTETPPPDAADALAVGLAHCYAHDPRKPQLQPSEPI